MFPFHKLESNVYCSILISRQVTLPLLLKTYIPTLILFQSYIIISPTRRKSLNYTFYFLCIIWHTIYKRIKSEIIKILYAKSLGLLVMIVITLMAERLKLGSHSEQK